MHGVVREQAARLRPPQVVRAVRDVATADGSVVFRADLNHWSTIFGVWLRVPAHGDVISIGGVTSSGEQLVTVELALDELVTVLARREWGPESPLAAASEAVDRTRRVS